jgi:hypothetical protein
MTDFKIDNPAVLYLSGGTMIGVILNLVEI